MKTRLYAVTVQVGESVKKYLVDAGQKGTARSHVAAKHVSVEIADGKTVAALMHEGVKMESAIEQPSGGEQPSLPQT